MKPCSGLAGLAARARAHGLGPTIDDVVHGRVQGSTTEDRAHVYGTLAVQIPGTRNLTLRVACKATQGPRVPAILIPELLKESASPGARTPNHTQVLPPDSARIQKRPAHPAKACCQVKGPHSTHCQSRRSECARTAHKRSKPATHPQLKDRNGALPTSAAAETIPSGAQMRGPCKPRASA